MKQKLRILVVQLTKPSGKRWVVLWPSSSSEEDVLEPELDNTLLFVDINPHLANVVQFSRLVRRCRPWWRAASCYDRVVGSRNDHQMIGHGVA